MLSGMSPGSKHTVADVARLSGVSVRALHHWDELGLLVPSARSEAGYRLYDDDDLLRLQQILLGRALGMSLADIQRLLDDACVDRRALLLSQRQRLLVRLDETAGMIRAVDAALAALDPNTEPPMDRKTLFDGFNPADHDEEAAGRWGHTPAFAESKRRTARCTPADWQRLKGETAATWQAAVALQQQGVAADSVAAMDVAERARLDIDRWFYPCDHAMHRGLADLYEADARFAASIDRFGADLTPFVVAAIRANAARHGA